MLLLTQTLFLDLDLNSTHDPTMLLRVTSRPRSAPLSVAAEAFRRLSPLVQKGMDARSLTRYHARTIAATIQTRYQMNSCCYHRCCCFVPASFGAHSKKLLHPSSEAGDFTLEPPFLNERSTKEEVRMTWARELNTSDA